MKKIFLFLVIFALSFGAKAQTWTPIFGKQRFASGLGIPTKDSTYFAGAADSSLIYINPKDAGLYYKYKGYHKKVGTGTVSSIALTMPSAFSVSGSPITNNGTFIVTGAGSITQYIRGDGSLATLNTAVVPESGNLYYTDARARAAISGTSPISVTSGVVSISQASGSTNGYLSSADWTTFNSKQTALNGTGFVKQSGTTTSYDNTTYYPASNPNGYTSNTGTVTSVALTAPSAFTVTGSPVTTSGTLAIAGAGNSTQYIDGSGSLQTFPTMLSSDNLIKLVRNQSGATMTAGTIVYIDGATGNKPTIAKALATSDATSAQTYGAVQADIANNADGYIVVIGNINNLNTSGLTEGAQLYLSSTTAGAYTTTKQYAPAHLVYVGVVLRAHPTQGIIGVKIQNGYELDELHNVAAQTPSNNDGLFYESSTSLWKNKSISTVLGYTPEQPLTFSAPLSRSVNTVSIPAATGSVNGYLSSTDWTTFNGKQAALSGTGFVKISGTTISYDNSTYLTTSSAASTYVPYTGATTDLVLGANNFSAKRVSVLKSSDGFGGFTSNYLYLGTGTSIAAVAADGVSLFSKPNTRGLVINYDIGGVNYGATLDASSMTASRTYTLPDASGTIALTSGLTGFVSGSGTSGQVPLFNGTQSVTNSQIYDNGSTVSIGNSVTSPNRLVSFSTNASGFAILGSGSAGAGGVYASITSGTGNMFQGSTSNGGYHIVDNAGNTYISGKVGIGTFSSSSYNLNVVGTGNFNGVLTVNSPSASEALVLNGTANSQYIAINSITGAEAMTKYYNPTAGSWYTGVRTTAGLGSTSSYHVYSSAYSGGDVFVLNTDGNAKFANSVTVGINSSSNYGTINDVGIFNNAITGGTPSNPAYYGGIRFTGGGYDWGAIRTIQTNPSASWLNRLAFFTQNGAGGAALTERMAITNDGLVGIGTSSPSATLHVVGSQLFDGNGAVFKRTGVLSGQSWNLGIDNAGLSFYDNTNSAYRLTINSAGQIGVGTNSVNSYAKFEVSGNIMSSGSSTILMLNNTGGTAQSWWLGQDVSGSNDGIFYIYNQTSSSQAINIRKNNNVLIGTTTDNGVKLQVQGEINSLGAASAILIQARNLSVKYGFYANDNTQMFFYNSAIGAIGTFSASTGIYSPLSDRNKKKDFEISNIGLKEILQLKPTLYRMKTDDTNGIKELGFIAQDVKEIIPNAYIESKDFIGLNFNPIVAALTKAIQELKAELDTTKNELNQKITNLEAQIKQ